MAETKNNGANLGFENQMWSAAEDRDEYAAANIFWVPKEARWTKLQSSAKQPIIGKIIDDAMLAIEKENPTLKGVPPKDLRVDFILANPPFNMSDWGGHILFIDARKLGSLIDRTHKDFSDEEIDKVAAAYHGWRGEKDAGEYKDVPGFCKSATIDEIKEHGYVLTPGRYVGAVEIEDDGVPFEEKMAELSAALYEQFAEADQLESVIKRNLETLGYGL